MRSPYSAQAARRVIAHERGFVLGPAELLTLVCSGTVAAVLLAINAAPVPLRFDPPLLAHITGLLAGYGVAVMLVLMSRTPVLERGVGADRLARWHGIGGRLIFALIGVHAVAATQVWVRASGRSVPMAMLDLLGLPGLLTATVGTVIFFAVRMASARAARHKLSYEWWHLLHLATYLAAGLAFGHQLAGPDLAGRRIEQVGWGLLYTYAYALVLRYRCVAPLQQACRHRLRVRQVIPEADGVVSIVIGGRHLHELNAEPGQFFGWRFLSAGTWRSAHPFSLSAPPRGEAMRITVKALGEGSRRLQALRPGTPVLAEGPYGAMTAQRRTQRAVLLIAGGIGITPMRALFETIDVPGERLTLLYRASTERDLIFRDELDAIARWRGARVIYLIGPSSHPANQLAPAILSAMVPGLREHDVYLCASPGLAAAVRVAVRGAGLPRSQFHEEVFEF
jgi:ferredoxin-NADP reductase/DMSO/TMAO reductase YedYZ heme-binding membrane subunit